MDSEDPLRDGLAERHKPVTERHKPVTSSLHTPALYCEAAKRLRIIYNPVTSCATAPDE